MAPSGGRFAGPLVYWTPSVDFSDRVWVVVTLLATGELIEVTFFVN